MIVEKTKTVLTVGLQKCFFWRPEKEMAIEPKTQHTWIQNNSWHCTGQVLLFWNSTKHTINHCEKNKKWKRKRGTYYDASDGHLEK